MKYKHFYQFLGVIATLSVASCEKDNNVSNPVIQEGYLQLEVIVNPLIHPYAQSTYLNIEDVRLGDNPIERLIPDEGLEVTSTVPIQAVQLGSRAPLSPAGYSNLAIDFSASGADPCHLKGQQNALDVLSSESGEIHTIHANGSFLVENGVTTKQVLHLDLNRFIRKEDGAQIDFSFRQNLGQLSPRMQLYNPETIGKINGQLIRTEAAPRQTYRLVAYAYETGKLMQPAEIKNGFSSAFTSAVIQRNDQFSFPVLPEGTYDIVIAHYIDDDQDGILEFKELLQADADIHSNIRIARVSPNTATSIEVKLGGAIED